MSRLLGESGKGQWFGPVWVVDNLGCRPCIQIAQRLSQEDSVLGKAPFLVRADLLESFRASYPALSRKTIPYPKGTLAVRPSRKPMVVFRDSARLREAIELDGWSPEKLRRWGVKI